MLPHALSTLSARASRTHNKLPQTKTGRKKAPRKLLRAAYARCKLQVNRRQIRKKKEVLLWLSKFRKKKNVTLQKKRSEARKAVEDVLRVCGAECVLERLHTHTDEKKKASGGKKRKSSS